MGRRAASGYVKTIFGHRPYVRRLPGLTVCNSGSAGLPFDGDWRASYLLIDPPSRGAGGAVEIRRVEYDLERELAELTASGYPDAERLAAIRRTGRFVAPP